MDDRERLEVVLDELLDHIDVFYENSIDIARNSEHDPIELEACLKDADRMRQILDEIVGWVRRQPQEFWLDMLSKEEPR